MKRPGWGQGQELGHHQIWDCSHFSHWTVNTFDKTEAWFCFSDLWHSCWAQNKIGRSTFHFLSPSPFLMTIIPSKMTWTQSQMLVILVSGLCIQSAAISNFIFYGLFISKTEKCISITKCSISGPEELLNWLIPISALRSGEKSQRQRRGEGKEGIQEYTG